MYSARRLDQWWHTAAVMCQLANTNREPKKQPYKAVQFLPPDLQREVKHAGGSGMRLTKKSLPLLKPLFEKGGRS